MNKQNNQFTIQAGSLAVLSAVLWGGNTVTLKIALGALTPMTQAGIRFTLGVFVIVLWSAAIRVSLRIKRGELGTLAMLSLLFLVQIYLFNDGTRITLASRATVLMSTHPFFTALLAHLFIPGDRLNPAKVIGMTLSFVGVAFIFGEGLVTGKLEHLRGDLMVVVSAVLLGARLVYVKRLTRDIHPGKLLFWQAVFSIPVFFVSGICIEGDTFSFFHPPVVLAVLYQGVVVAGLCFILQTTLIKRYSASRISAFGFITPAAGVLLSHLLLGEVLSGGILISLLLIGIGITVVNRSPAVSPSPEAKPSRL